jgi:hypothetical protein
MVLANLTYLDSLNRYIVLSSYKALMAICDQKVVSTQPESNYMSRAELDKRRRSGASKCVQTFIRRFLSAMRLSSHTSRTSQYHRKRMIRVHTTGGRGSFRGKTDVHAEISIKIAEYTPTPTYVCDRNALSDTHIPVQ